MAEVNTFVSFSTVGVGETLNLPFTALDTANIVVKADGVVVSTTLYEFTTATSILTLTGFPVNTTVLVYSRTPVDADEELQSGSTVYDWELVNQQFEKSFMVLQEHRDFIDASIKTRPGAAAISNGKVPIMGADGFLVDGPTANEITAAQGYAVDAQTAAASSSIVTATTVTTGLTKVLGVNASDAVVKSTKAGVLEFLGVGADVASLLDDTSLANMRTTLGLVPGTDVQPQNTTLAALALRALAANKLPYMDSVSTMALTDLTAAARTFLAAADGAAQRSAIGAIIGTDVQAQNANLSALAGLTGANNKIGKFTGDGAMALLDILGTVAQSGGAPTGSLFTYGSNANGYYIRLAANLQVCWYRDATGLACSIASGNIFASGGTATWTYPAPFASADGYIMIAMPESGTRWAGCYKTDATAGIIRHYGPTSSATSVPHVYLAIGPWF